MPHHLDPTRSLFFQCPKRSIHLWICSVLLLFFCTPAVSWAAQVTLAWDPNNPSPDGYRLYQRAQGHSYDYSRPVWTGGASTCTIDNLADNTQYYFVVRAYAGNMESRNSNEVGFRTPGSNHAPRADAGTDQTVDPGTRITLDGTGSSDPDGDALAYSWSQTAGPSVSLSNRSTPQPTFTAPTGNSSETVLTFRLTVGDGNGLSDTDTCRVVVRAAQQSNGPPVANAGSDQTVSPNTNVQLDGSQSRDPEGLVLTYQWRQTTGPGVTLLNAKAARASFTAPAAAASPIVMTFELSVRDPQGLSATDTCQVIVAAASAPVERPVAQAGANQTVFEGTTVRLNGSGSLHPEGLPLTYRWIQTSGPSVPLSGANTARPAFSAPRVDAGTNVTLVFELTVTDSRSMTSSDTCIVRVLSDPNDNDGAEDPTDDPDRDQPTEPDKGSPDPEDDPEDPAAPTETSRLPMQPMIYYPAEMATGIDLTPKLTASAFSGAAAGDYHTRSRWLIIQKQNHRVVFDVTRAQGSLNALWVPFFILAQDTTYTCQVRYTDNHGRSSEWSQPVTFTTRSGGWGIWGEGDLETDTSQSETTAAQTSAIVNCHDRGCTLAVDIADSPSVTAVENMAFLQPEQLDPLPAELAPYPYGLLGYRLGLDRRGQHTAVTFHFSEPIPPGTSWIAYGADGQWMDCTDQIIVHENGRTVQRTIQDGGTADIDGVSNGFIVDILGPLQTTDTSDETGGDTRTGDLPAAGSTGGGCFIGIMFE